MNSRTIISAFLFSFVAISAHARTAPNLGNLKGPLQSLSGITSIAESLQKGTKNEITKLIDENDCQRKIVLPDEQPPLEAGDMKVSQFLVEISGPGCPVAYSMSLTGKQEPDGFTANFALKYASQSKEAKAMYDIDNAEFVGAITAKILQAPGGNGGGIEFNFKYDGKGNSQSQGAFSSLSGMGGKMMISMGAAQGLKIEGGFEESLKFDFKTESATLKSVTTLTGLNPVATFEINGKTVTSDEYKTVRDLIKLPGMENSGIGSAGDPSTLECRAEVFRGADFSVAQANQWIKNGGAKPAALKTSRSCGGMSTDMDQVEKVPYTATFTADPSHTSIRVELCGAGAPCSAAERLFLPDESAAFVDELLGRYTVVTSCSVVAVCTR